MQDNSAAILSPNGNYGNTEAGFGVSYQGVPTKVETHTNRGMGGDIPQVSTPDTMMLVHTHPPITQIGQTPSPGDIANAERLKKPILMISKEGLFEVDAQGHVQQVFQGLKFLKSPGKGKK